MNVVKLQISVVLLHILDTINPFIMYHSLQNVSGFDCSDMCCSKSEVTTFLKNCNNKQLLFDGL